MSLTTHEKTFGVGKCLHCGDAVEEAKAAFTASSTPEEAKAAQERLVAARCTPGWCEWKVQLQVSTTKLPVLAAIKLFPRLGKILAPVLSSIEGGLFTLDTNVSLMGPALMEIFHNLSGEELISLFRDIAVSTSVVRFDENGRLRQYELKNDQSINAAFEGFSPFTVIHAAWFIIQVNYMGFTNAGPQREFVQS